MKVSVVTAYILGELTYDVGERDGINPAASRMTAACQLIAKSFAEGTVVQRCGLTAALGGS
jgi:hypothetical protein